MNLDPKKFKWWCCLKGVIGYYSMVVELIMHYCGQILYDSFETFETYKTILYKLTFNIIFLGGYVLRIVFFLILNNDDKK